MQSCDILLSEMSGSQQKMTSYTKKYDSVTHTQKKSLQGQVAQSVKHLTLDLSSGLDLRVVSSSSSLGSALGMEPI